jgi:hypothetical protein
MPLLDFFFFADGGGWMDMGPNFFFLAVWREGGVVDMTCVGALGD